MRLSFINTVLLICPVAYSTTIFVPSQYPTIQAGINAAVDGDTVLVADGIYTGIGNKNLDYLGKAIVVTSENGAENCIIDCQNDGQGFNFHSFEDSGSVLSGFTIMNGGNVYEGGAIRCYYSGPVINNCKIIENSASEGGGIFCWKCNPIIYSNLISDNTSFNMAGGIACYDLAFPLIWGNIITRNSANGTYCAGGISMHYTSYPTIINNIIYDNHSTGSGGIYCHYSDPVINDNIIAGNSGENAGGGLRFLNASNANICDNIIRGNRASVGGGIYYQSSLSMIFRGNEIVNNIATVNAGGLYLHYYDFELNKCTIAYNQAVSAGGIYVSTCDPTLRNSIVWGNTAEQISPSAGSNVQVTYSDIQNGWPGTGNLNQEPAFVDTLNGDYRLLWASPCIDSGDPNAIYNDPDGTRADMGAYYYDQSPPVQVLVRPREIPYLIPAEGGTLEFTIRGKNRELVALTITFWCDVTLPDCTIYGPVLGPLDLTIPPGETLVRDRRQNVPAVAPMGVYYFNAYAILGADTSKDSFMWGKLGVGVWRLGNGKWANTGEAFKTVLTEEQRIPNNIPNDFNVSLYPNPFNAGAKISYTLPETEHIRIAIYDLSGREVSILVEGIINAGMNEAVFDGSELPCGIYFVKLQTAEFQKTQKIVLLK